MSSWKLADLVDLSTVQQVADTLYQAARIPVRIMVGGKVLVRAGAQPVCQDFFLRHPATKAACRQHAAIFDGYRDTATPLTTQCGNTLRNMAYPLIVDGHYLATLVVGPFLFTDDIVDEAALRALARQCGFDADALLASFVEIPRFTPAQTGAIITHYTTLVQALVTAGHHQKSLERHAESLRISREQYRQLFDAHTSTMLLIDADTLTITAANPAACRFYGYSAEALVGSPLTRVSCLSEEQLHQYFSEVQHGTRERYLARHRLATGEVHDVDVYTGPFDIDGARQVFAIIHDVTEEMASKRALAAERERLAVTLQSMGDGVIATDAEGQVTLLNHVAETLTGWNAATAVGQPLETVFHIVNEETRALVPNPVRRVLAEGCIVGLANHTVLIAKDGEERPIADSGAPIRTAGEAEVQGAVLVFRDQTEERAQERKLRESEQRFRSLFESAVEGVALHELVCDDSGTPIDYRLLDLNPAFEKHTGIDGATVRGKLATEAYGTETAPYLEAYARVALTGEPYVFETYFPPMDRYFVVSVWAPRHGQFVTSFEDITARKRAEEAVLEEKERLMVTLRSIGDGVITTDTRGCVVLMNRKAEELTGWRQADAHGRPLTEVFHIIHEHTRHVCENPVDRVLRSGQIVELANHTALIAKDGAERIIADSGAPIRNMQSEVIGVVLVFRDITLESHLHAEMQRMAKLDSLGVMAGGIAHDFNNLLTAISGNMGLAQYALQNHQTERLQRYLAEAENAAIRARDLTQQLLTFARGGAPIRKQLDPRPLVREAVAFALTGSRCQGVVDLPEHLWLINADAGQLGQVLHNLLLNADQAMPQGGAIHVRLENIRLDKETMVPLPAGDYVKLSVTDEGTGILPELREKVFDPFFTTKQRGSGLGLASVFSIVRAHDGHISIESAVGKGSTFTIYLPAAAHGMRQGEPCDAAPARADALRILVLDDEAMIAAVLIEMLTQAGHEVVATADGAAALIAWRDARASGRPFDLGIFDLTIPGGMGGKEAIARLRVEDPSFRAIASSGYATDPIMAHYAEYGFSGCLAKPYRISEVLEAIDLAMAGQE